MKTLLILASWVITLGIALAQDKPFGVIVSAKVHDQIVPNIIAKIGETCTRKVLSVIVTPKSEPPFPDIGWVMDITPEMDKENKFVGKIVICNTTVKIDNGEIPLVTSTESIFRFSLPVDGASYTKDLPGLGKAILKLELIDAVGKSIKDTEQVVAPNRP